jgi:glycosyltransferase involved in cell wall biosynthesis
VSGLRFAMVTTFYPPYNFGGDGMAVQRLARALVRRGHQVTVVHDADAYEVLSPAPAPVETGQPDGVDVVTLRSRWRGLSLLLTQQTGRPVVNGGRLRRLLEGGGFDVINYHNVSLVGGPGVLAIGRGLKIYSALEHWLVCPTHVLWRHRREPCIGRECLRCQIRYRRPPQIWRYTGLLERQLRHVDALIAMSEFSRDKHREFGLARPMDVVPGFLPSEDHSGPNASPHPRPYFLCLGRLTRIKGLEAAIEAFRDRPVADLVIAGTGEDESALRALAAGSPTIHFTGRVPSAAVTAYYRHALALVAPSAGYETFGFVLIEAFREGTPVIARRIGPFPEMVARSEGGEVFSTPDELRAAAGRIAGDPAYRQRLSRNAYAAYLRHWTEDAVLPRYLDVVRRAAERRGLTRITDALQVEAA